MLKRLENTQHHFVTESIASCFLQVKAIIEANRIDFHVLNIENKFAALEISQRSKLTFTFSFEKKIEISFLKIKKTDIFLLSILTKMHEQLYLDMEFDRGH